MTKDKTYVNWEKLILHCDTLHDLTKNEREAAKDAFRFLKAELGDRFLIEASKEKHPFVDIPHDRAFYLPVLNIPTLEPLRMERLGHESG